MSRNSNRGSSHNAKSSIWTPAVCATLKALAAARKSASQIAMEINATHKELTRPCTRNAVIGRANREGVTLHGKAPTPHASTPSAPRKPRKPNQLHYHGYLLKVIPRPPQPRQTAIARVAPPLPPCFLPLPAMDAGAAVLLLERACGDAPGNCHWPIGDPLSDDFRFCYAAAPNGSYCAYHQAIGTVKSKGGTGGHMRLANWR